MHVPLDLSDYGSAVNVTAPPAGEAFDTTGLAAMAGRSLERARAAARYRPLTLEPFGGGGGGGRGGMM